MDNVLLLRADGGDLEGWIEVVTNCWYATTVGWYELTTRMSTERYEFSCILTNFNLMDSKARTGPSARARKDGLKTRTILS